MMLTLGEHRGNRWSFSPHLVFLRCFGRLANEVSCFGEADDDVEEEAVVEAEEDEVAEALKLYEEGAGDNANISNRYAEYSTVVSFTQKQLRQEFSTRNETIAL